MDHVFWVVTGTARFDVAGETASLAAGGFALVPRGVAHTFANDSESEPASFLEVDVPGGFENYFRELGQALEQAGDLNPDVVRQIQSRYDTWPPET